MATRIRLALLAALAFTTLGAAPVAATGYGCDNGSSGSLDAFGLTANGRLICFEVATPEASRTVSRITGLAPDMRLVGIDFRPANGLLYGLCDLGGIYTIDTDDAVATKVSQLTIALTGSSFGVDFNPAADALRVVGNDGQNLRHPFSTGVTAMDGTLNYIGPPAVNPATGVTGAAYTNNDADPNTGTVLHDIDSSLDQLVIQAPPNSGILNMVGKLGLDVSEDVGFDIYSVIRDGTTSTVRGFASLSYGDANSLFRINLFTGKARFIGEFGPNVRDIALPLAQS